jgi:CPA2 family monovalent cation:H+ antiporter-2
VARKVELACAAPDRILGAPMAFLALAGPADLLRDLAMVLIVAALTTVVFQRLRQPVVLGYLLAGFVIGPHTPGATVRDVATLHTLSELGVILVLFSIGLEFRVARLVQLGPRVGFVAVLGVGTMLLAGSSLARAAGADLVGALFVGASVAISSTILIRKVFQELNVRGHIQEIVLSVLVFEDVVAVLLIAGLAPLGAHGGGAEGRSMLATAGYLLLFLLSVIVLGALVVPRALRFVIGLRRRETLIVASMGLCFGLALLAQKAGWPVALGAFLAGTLAAESGHGPEIDRRLQPVTDVFSAIFFVSIGTQIDPRVLGEHAGLILALTAAVLVVKVVSVALATFLVGEERKDAWRAGIAMGQIGEFSFVIAGVGVASGAAPPWILAVAAGVSTLTAFASPLLIARSEALAERIDRALPRAVQTYAALYAAWAARIRESRAEEHSASESRRALRALALDTALLFAVIVASALAAERLSRWLALEVQLPDWIVWPALAAGLGALAAPFVIGIARNSRRLALRLAERALPPLAAGRADPAAAPRRALVAGLQAAILLAVALLLLAASDPFLPRFSSPIVLASLAASLALALWRAAANLHGHVRAGAEVYAEALQLGVQPVAPDTGLDLLPGLGEVALFGLHPDSPAVGRSLGELALGPRCGALVLAITRGARRIPMPGEGERLEGGDLIALSGSEEAVEAAVAALGQRAPAALGAG